MKKLILSLCVLGALASCQKENQKVTNVKKPALGAKHLNLLPAYTDMTLQTDGSYTGYWNDCLIRVTAPAWDQVKYPTLVNGVPVMAGSLTTYDGTSSVDVANSGFDGNVFQVTQIYGLLSEFNADAFDSDLANYGSAIQTWMDNGQTGTRPTIGSYVKDTYSLTVGTNQVVTYTGKLIRVTTGSHLAIATISYALPAAQTVSGNPLSFAVYDAANNVYYAVSGSYNVITTGHNVSFTISYPATGTYSISGGVISATGTLIRADGTKFNFDPSMVVAN